MGVLCENHLFIVQIQSLSHIKKKIGQATTAVCTETLETVWKNLNSKFNRVITINNKYFGDHK